MARRPHPRDPADQNNAEATRAGVVPPMASCAGRPCAIPSPPHRLVGGSMLHLDEGTFPRGFDAGAARA
jgi:hypothetical protein